VDNPARDWRRAAGGTPSVSRGAGRAKYPDIESTTSRKRRPGLAIDGGILQKQPALDRPTGRPRSADARS